MRNTRLALLTVGACALAARGDGIECVGRSLLASVEMSGRFTDVRLVDGLAYVASGGTLRIFDLSLPYAPELVGQTPTLGPSYSLDIADGRAFIADGQGGLTIVDVADPAQPTVIGSVAGFGDAYSVDVEDSLAIVADVSGVTVIDVSDPANPQNLGSWGGFGEGNFYAADAHGSILCTGGSGFPWGSRLYVAQITEAPFGVQMLSSIDGFGLIVDVVYQGRYAFVARGGITVVDLVDPTQPLEIAEVFTPGSVYRIQLVEDRLFAAVSEGGLVEYDVSNPADPLLVSHLPLADVAAAVDSDGQVAAVCDEFFGLRVIDVSVPRTSAVVNTLWHDQSGRRLFGAGDVLVSAGTFRGVELIDASNPFAPETLALVETGDMVWDIDRAADLLFLSARKAGVSILDINTTHDPLLLSVIETPGNAIGVAERDGYAYIGCAEAGMIVADVRDPATPQIVHQDPAPGYTSWLRIAGSHLFVVNREAVRVFDLAAPDAPTLVTTYVGPDDVHFIEIESGRLYLALANGGFEIIDIQDPTDPVLLAHMPTTDRWDAMEIQADRLYQIRSGNIHGFDVSDPALPQPLFEVRVESRLDGFIADGAYAFGLRSFDLYTIDLSDCACLADLAPPFGVLDFYDLQRFLAYVSNADPRGDLNRDGVLDIHDALAFLDAYAAGCP